MDDSGGLLLVRIPNGAFGEDTSRLLGALVVARVWQAVQRRAARPEHLRPPMGLYVDEMHNYLALPRSFEDILAEARAYRLSLVLAHQHLGQLPRSRREALAANARTKIAFTSSPEDAYGLEKYFEPALSAHDLANLERFEAACRPLVAGGRLSAFTFRTEPLERPHRGRFRQVRNASGGRFAARRKAVEAQIKGRHDEIDRRVARPKRQRHDPPADAAYVNGDLVILKPIYEPLSAGDQDRRVEAIRELLRAHFEREAAREVEVTPPRATVRRWKTRKPRRNP